MCYITRPPKPCTCWYECLIQVWLVIIPCSVCTVFKGNHSSHSTHPTLYRQRSLNAKLRIFYFLLLHFLASHAAYQKLRRLVPVRKWIINLKSILHVTNRRNYRRHSSCTKFVMRRFLWIIRHDEFQIKLLKFSTRSFNTESRDMKVDSLCTEFVMYTIRYAEDPLCKAFVM